MENTIQYQLMNDGVYCYNGQAIKMICDHIDVLSRIRIDIPGAPAQSWLILGFRSRDGEDKQAMVRGSVLGDEHFWSLLGDLLEENFRVTRGFEEQVQRYLQQRFDCIHEFDVNQTLPTNSVYLSTDRTGWGGLYNNFVAGTARRQ